MSAITVLADALTRLHDSSAGICFLQRGERECRVPYAELLTRARGLLGRFQQQGLQAGDPVILFVRNNQAFVDAFWACQLGGLVPVPLSAGVHAETLYKLLAVIQEFSQPFLFTERDLLQRLNKTGRAEHLPQQRLCLLEDIAQLEGDGQLHQSAPGDTALIQFSSGSTRSPKGVVLSHANLLANIRAIAAAAAITEADATLSWMPLSHDMGLIGFHLVPLVSKLEQVLMDTELFMRRPARWLESAQHYRSSLLCSPNFGYRHYMKSVPTPPAALDLSAVRLIFNGAEPVSAPVCRAFAQQLAPAGLNAAAFYPVYGLAEASLAVTFPAPGSGVQSLRVNADSLSVGRSVVSQETPGQGIELVCLGQPVAGCELRVCDARGKALADGMVGHVQIRGDNVTRAYYHCPECDAQAFVDGWLDTGDLGLLHETGLYITGRAKEVLFVSGQNRYPQDLEALLQQNCAIESGKVAVGALRDADNAEDLLLVFVQFRRAPEDFVEQARQVQATLAETSGLQAHAVLPVHKLPHTTSGKLQRYRLVEAFANGEYRELQAVLQKLSQGRVTPTLSGAAEQQLLDVCRQVFPARDIQADQNLFELGADSLMLVKIHEEIEARFPGRVEITDLFEYPTISALSKYIERPPNKTRHCG